MATALVNGRVTMQRPIVKPVIEQHAADAAILHATRTRLTQAPHVTLAHLRRFDMRLAAHLDGLKIAGQEGSSMLLATLDDPSPSALFTATVNTIEQAQPQKLSHLLALAQSVQESQPGLRSAFGWVEAAALRGQVASLLNAADPFHRTVGIAAAAMHRVDPGIVRARQFEDADATVRARVFRTAGELGMREFVSTLAAIVQAETDPACRFWAAWSAVLLGDRQRALEFIHATAMQEGPFRQRAWVLALLAMPSSAVIDSLRSLAADPAQKRWAVRAVGLLGNPSYIPWLIEQMSNDALARVAAESFSLITGADLALLDLERRPPEHDPSGPNDDPNDPRTDIGEDEDLPWPEVERIQAWWQRHQPQFEPNVRHFVGAPVTREHCIEVLRTGYQRQRILAAHHLCLLEPGSVLFEWRAPAWRQAQALAALA
jgi:uncharacterized protein (TIGR02270 family)